MSTNPNVEIQEMLLNEAHYCFTTVQWTEGYLYRLDKPNMNYRK